MSSRPDTSYSHQRNAQNVNAPTHYDVLKIPATATEDEIKKSYRALVQVWHPDRNLANRDKAEEKIRRINEAYANLANAKRRHDYDQTLARQRRISARSGKREDSLLKQFLTWLKTGETNGR